MSHRMIAYTLIAAAALAAACGGEKKTTPNDAPGGGATAAASSTPSSTGGGPFTPDPGGKVITVELITDGVGNYFKPAEITAKRGDVVRYTLKVGVHNVHFLPDSNAGRSGYPQAASDLLQLPGQTYDVKASFAPGTYYFQCDPHAALGMRGHLTVQ
jgi:plastocyanin